MVFPPHHGSPRWNLSVGPRINMIQKGLFKNSLKMFRQCMSFCLKADALQVYRGGRRQLTTDRGRVLRKVLTPQDTVRV
jgi:hypothetical protein